MDFGLVPLADAEGAILAHSLQAGALRLKKGRRLSRNDLAALAAAGVDAVVAARLTLDDLPEDDAAARLAAALAPDPPALGLSVSAPFTGRANLFAAKAGVLAVDAAAVDAFNAVDPAITLATLPRWARVEARAMVATVKIIPYAAPAAAVERAARRLGASTPLRVQPFRPVPATLVLTRTPGGKESLLAKGQKAVADRLSGLGATLAEVVAVPHETAPLAAALRAAQGDVVLVLTASATSDARDTAPAALLAAGGTLARFGMPVDPGNLLFLGRLGHRHVVGLPGCVRSPALNGADWVLERLVAGLDVSPADIAGMGVGGLLKEIPTRPQPRTGEKPSGAGRPRVEAVILAAGAGRRMRGRDKLLERVGAVSALAAAVRAALASGCDRVVVVIPPGADARRAVLEGLSAHIVEAPASAEGMSGSLRAGIAAISPSADAAVVMLGDMPEVGPAHVDRLIAAFDPGEGREICRATDDEGRPGHPVLFGRRFFENLRALTGDTGARDILREGAEYLVEVPTPGRGARLDLDTPEEWAAWAAGRPD